MKLVTAAFYLLLGAWFLGFHFQYQEPILGILAVIIGIVALF